MLSSNDGTSWTIALLHKIIDTKCDYVPSNLNSAIVSRFHLKTLLLLCTEKVRFFLKNECCRLIDWVASKRIGGIRRTC